MRKITLAALVVVATMFVALFAGAGAANATDDQPSSDNKKVTLCHATSSETNPYNKIEVSVSAFYSAGHIDHSDDIWEAFSYVTKGGETVNVPARGNTALLAFEDCEEPATNEKVAKPEPTFTDPCDTENDVFSVAPGRGYTVGSTTTDGVKQTITVTLAEGFEWADGSTAPISFERPVFTNIDCDIPDTGAPQYATGMGALALAGMVALGGMTLLRRRQNV